VDYLLYNFQFFVGNIYSYSLDIIWILPGTDYSKLHHLKPLCQSRHYIPYFRDILRNSA
jgi:hypothetical protein